MRSIDSLHVELVPAPGTAVSDKSFSPTSAPPSAQVVGGASERPTSSESTATQSTGNTNEAGDEQQATIAKVLSDPSAATASNTTTAPPPPLVIRERRHQIPGLRKTPYLKIYLLRCDDNETYKTSTKKAVKGWVKECTANGGISATNGLGSSPRSTSQARPGSSSATAQKPGLGIGKRKEKGKGKGKLGQGDHDAFEWLILHVVVPGTVAAGQIKVGGDKSTSRSETAAASATNSGDGESLRVSGEKQTSGGDGGSGRGPKWPGRGTRTILERLQSDFNTSGKSAPDRVAQIRLDKSTIPSHMLPSTFDTTTAASQVESPAEQERTLSDLAAKMKVLILLSFGLRVRQYEEDIREREAQRDLPGWNFCTFFMLKEGLARGFESVGLVDDALTVYDELDAELASVLDEEYARAAAGEASFTGAIQKKSVYLRLALLDMLKDIDDKFGGRESEGATLSSDVERYLASSEIFQAMSAKPLNPGNLNYRELILSNQISVFEFKCYIFLRQVALLLRLARVCKVDDDDSYGGGGGAIASTPNASRRAEESEDPVALVEVCRRTLRFISSVSRTLKEDLLLG